jgi:hypothetical protein
MTAAQSKWIKLIHVAKTKCGLDDDAYRALLSSAGISSAKEITTWEQYHTVMEGFKKLGFSARPLKQQQEQSGRNPDWISAKQEYYIKGLWDLASRKRDEKSLRAICKRITGGDDISFCHKADATKLILALRKITEDAGYNPDTKDRG